MLPTLLDHRGAADFTYTYECTWIVVRDADNDPFIVAPNEDGELFYTGMPVAADEEGTAAGPHTGMLTDDDDEEGHPVFPLTVLGRS